MIRKATHADIDAIVALSLESVSSEPLPVQVDEAAIRAMAKAMVGNPAHFVWVGEQAGKVTACVAAQVMPGFWFKGLQASVLLYFATQPGDGVSLIRRFSGWVKSRPAIKMAVLEFEPKHDPRLERLFVRLGFARRSMNLTFVRTP